MAFASSSSSSPSARRRRELERLYSPVRAREFRPLAARTTARREDDGAAVETTETVMVADRGVRITRDAGRGRGREDETRDGETLAREVGGVRERDGHHERFRLLGRLVLAVGAVSSLFFFSSADSAASASSSLALR